MPNFGTLLDKSSGNYVKYVQNPRIRWTFVGPGQESPARVRTGDVRVGKDRLVKMLPSCTCTFPKWSVMPKYVMHGKRACP